MGLNPFPSQPCPLATWLRALTTPQGLQRALSWSSLVPPRVPIHRRPGELIRLFFKHLLRISSVCRALSLCLGFVVVVVQLLIHVQQFVAPRTTVHQTSLSFTISRNLLRLMSIESAMPSNHLILCRSLLFLPSIFPSIRVFSSESALHIKWLKYWSFSFSISPSSEYSGLISFRIDWFDLLAVQGLERSKNRCSL